MNGSQELHLSLEQIIKFADQLEDTYENVFEITNSKPTLVDQTIRRVRQFIHKLIIEIESDVNKYLDKLADEFIRMKVAEYLLSYKESKKNSKEIKEPTSFWTEANTIPNAETLSFIEEKRNFYCHLIDCTYKIPDVFQDNQSHYWQTITEVDNYMPGFENCWRYRTCETYLHNFTNVLKDLLKNKLITDSLLVPDVMQFLALYQVRESYLFLKPYFDYGMDGKSIDAFKDSAIKIIIIKIINDTVQTVDIINGYSMTDPDIQKCFKDLSETVKQIEALNNSSQKFDHKANSSDLFLDSLDSLVATKSSKPSKHKLYLPNDSLTQFLHVFYYLYEMNIDFFRVSDSLKVKLGQDTRIIVFDAVLQDVIKHVQEHLAPQNAEFKKWSDEVPSEFNAKGSQYWKAIIYQGEANVNHFEADDKDVGISRRGIDPHPNCLWIRFLFDKVLRDCYKKDEFNTNDYSKNFLKYLFVLYNVRKIFSNLFHHLEDKLGVGIYKRPRPRPSRGIILNIELMRDELIFLSRLADDEYKKHNLPNIYECADNFARLLNVMFLKNFPLAQAVSNIESEIKAFQNKFLKDDKDKAKMKEALQLFDMLLLAYEKQDLTLPNELVMQFFHIFHHLYELNIDFFRVNDFIKVNPGKDNRIIIFDAAIQGVINYAKENLAPHNPEFKKWVDNVPDEFTTNHCEYWLAILNQGEVSVKQFEQRSEAPSPDKSTWINTLFDKVLPKYIKDDVLKSETKNFIKYLFVLYNLRKTFSNIFRLLEDEKEHEKTSRGVLVQMASMKEKLRQLSQLANDDYTKHGLVNLYEIADHVGKLFDAMFFKSFRITLATTSIENQITAFQEKFIRKGEDSINMKEALKLFDMYYAAWKKRDLQRRLTPRTLPKSANDLLAFYNYKIDIAAIKSDEDIIQKYEEFKKINRDESLLLIVVAEREGKWLLHRKETDDLVEWTPVEEIKELAKCYKDHMKGKIRGQLTFADKQTIGLDVTSYLKNFANVTTDSNKPVTRSKIDLLSKSQPITRKRSSSSIPFPESKKLSKSELPEIPDNEKNPLAKTTNVPPLRRVSLANRDESPYRGRKRSTADAPPVTSPHRRQRSNSSVGGDFQHSGGAMESPVRRPSQAPLPNNPVPESPTGPGHVRKNSNIRLVKSGSSNEIPSTASPPVSPKLLDVIPDSEKSFSPRRSKKLKKEEKKEKRASLSRTDSQKDKDKRRSIPKDEQPAAQSGRDKRKSMPKEEQPLSQSAKEKRKSISKEESQQITPMLERHVSFEEKKEDKKGIFGGFFSKLSKSSKEKDKTSSPNKSKHPSPKESPREIQRELNSSDGLPTIFDTSPRKSKYKYNESQSSTNSSDLASDPPNDHYQDSPRQ